MFGGTCTMHWYNNSNRKRIGRELAQARLKKIRARNKAQKLSEKATKLADAALKNSPKGAWPKDNPI